MNEGLGHDRQCLLNSLSPINDITPTLRCLLEMDKVHRWTLYRCPINSRSMSDSAEFS